MDSSNLGCKTDIGPGLSLYAKFPNEVDLIWYRDDDEKLKRDHFQDMERAKFDHLVSRIENLFHVIELDAKVLVEQFADRVSNAKLSDNVNIIKSVQRVQLKIGTKYWTCKFRVLRKYAKRQVSAPIHFGFVLESQDGQLFARSWIWVRGVQRSWVSDRISRFSPRFRKLPPCPVWPKDESLMLANENVLTLLEADESASSIVQKAFLPIELITPRSWAALLDAPKI